MQACLQAQANAGKMSAGRKCMQIQAKSSLPYKKFMGFYRERTKYQYLHGTYAAYAHIVYTYAAQCMYVACPPEWPGFWLNLIGLLTSAPTVPMLLVWLLIAGADDAGLAGCDLTGRIVLRRRTLQACAHFANPDRLEAPFVWPCLWSTKHT